MFFQFCSIFFRKQNWKRTKKNRIDKKRWCTLNWWKCPTIRYRFRAGLVWLASLVEEPCSFCTVLLIDVPFPFAKNGLYLLYNIIHKYTPGLPVFWQYFSEISLKRRSSKNRHINNRQKNKCPKTIKKQTHFQKTGSPGVYIISMQKDIPLNPV